jgi:hypothetical protein
MKKYWIQAVVVAAILLMAGCSAVAPEPAHSPSPSDGATGVLAGIDLAWVGPEDATFNVYFGTSASFGTPAAQGLTVDLYDPAPLDDLTPGTTYYWRVDSVVDGNTIEGFVWSFTLAL